jgi:hypothetical protein
MTKRIHTLAMMAAAGALLAVPAVGEANHKPSHNKGGQGGSGQARGCTKHPTVNKGFTVRGTLVSYTADNAATTAVNEAGVEITVTSANRAAKVSGELSDQDAGKPGVQVKGGSYTVSGNGSPADAFSVKLSGYEAMESPAAGDRVRIAGKIAVTRRKCAAAGANVDDRYGDVNVRRVRIIDAD